MKIATRVSFLLLLASSSCLWTVGCGRPPQTRSVKVKVSSTRVTDDPVVPVVSDLLRRGANAEDWRNYVQQLNRYLRDHPNAQPRPLSTEERALLAKELHLDKKELAELENSTFTPLDAHYLELAFVLRDTVRALQIDGLPPLDRVRRAFAWVVRQVRLQEGEAIPVPPLPVLRRGWGSSQERALVFLALLDQIGIDGCMITVPAKASAQLGAAIQPRTPNQGANVPNSPARAWVPGARIDKEIYLFDTRLGLPLPGANDKQIATLAQVRAGLDLRQILSPTRERGNVPRSRVGLKSLNQYPYDVGPAESRHAEVQVAYSLSSLAPRMQLLQTYLAGSEKVNLWIDPVARFRRLQAAAGTVGVWNPPEDANNPLRVLRAFLPREEGGVAQQPFRAMVQQQEIPWQYFPAPLRAMPGKPGEQLRALFAAPFVYFSLETRMPPERFVAWLPGLSEESADKPGRRKLAENLLRSPLPRDLMLHGRFDEAVTLLVAIEQELRRQKARPGGPPLDAKVRQWCEKALAAYSDLIRAEQEAGPQGGKDAASTGPVAAARERVFQLWGPEGKPISDILQRSMADPMLERVVYLLALCKQEQAEGKAGTDAWRSASSWWKTYLREYGSAPTAPAARLLRARALQALGERQEAVALLEDLSGVSTDLEKTSRLYQATRLKAP
jgi:hypothetical protein